MSVISFHTQWIVLALTLLALLLSASTCSRPWPTYELRDKQSLEWLQAGGTVAVQQEERHTRLYSESSSGRPEALTSIGIKISNRTLDTLTVDVVAFAPKSERFDYRLLSATASSANDSEFYVRDGSLVDLPKLLQLEPGEQAQISWTLSAELDISVTTKTEVRERFAGEELRLDTRAISPRGNEAPEELVFEIDSV